MKNIIFDARQVFVHLGLVEAEEAAAFVERSFGADLPLLVERFRQEYDGIVDERNVPIEIDYETRAREIAAAYQQHLRRALFVALYSSFENELELLCKHLAERQLISLRPADLSGRGVVRATNFLKKVLGLTIPETQSAWREIQVFGKIRNTLAHRGGRLYKDDDRQIVQWLQTTGCGDVANDELNLNETAHPYAVRVLRDFWAGLFDELRRHRQENRL